MCAVEWKKLGDVCEIKTGKGITTKDCSVNGQYPIISGGITPMGVYHQFNRKANTTTISRVGANAGFVNFITQDFYLNDKCFSVIPFDDAISTIDVKYLFFKLKSIEEEIVSLQSEGGVPTINTSKVGNLIIPIPSLVKQQEIVSQLDTFTTLISNLESELDMRRKQYEHYRNQLYGDTLELLLDKSEKGEIEISTLSEVGIFTRGRRFVRTDIMAEGTPCIHYGDMYTYYGVSAKSTPTYLLPEVAAKLRFAQENDVVIVGAGENNEDIGIGVAWLGQDDVAVHDACYIFKHQMNPLYVSYYLRTDVYHKQIKKYVSSGKICSISSEGIGKAIIPIPTPETQREIVEKLDAFEQLIQSLETEIKLRKQQYEYYREKLLTFE